MKPRSRTSETGFTLVEIMIVVLIIGILLAIAIPNFVAARESSRAKACVGNLKQIDSAKQQAAMDNKLNGTATATFKIDGTTASTSPPTQAGVYQLVGTSGYIRATPVCPSSGVYTNAAGTLGSVETLANRPTCSITGAAGTGYAAPTATTPAEKWYHGLTN